MLKLENQSLAMLGKEKGNFSNNTAVFLGHKAKIRLYL
jgi:hypothetical protein